jgi:hypothetical protein
MGHLADVGLLANVRFAPAAVLFVDRLLWNIELTNIRFAPILLKESKTEPLRKPREIRRLKPCEAITRIPGSLLCVSTWWLTLSSAGRANSAGNCLSSMDNGLFQSVRHKGASIAIASPQLFEKLRLSRPTA